MTPSSPKTPKSKNVDYILVFDEGKLDPGHTVVRASVSDGKETLQEMGALKIQLGFGIDIPSAIADFMRRNDSRVINRIFDKDVK